MIQEVFLYTGMFFFFLASLVSLLRRLNSSVYFLSIAGSLCFGILGIYAIFLQPVSLTFFLVYEFSLGGDPLSGYFLLLISIVSISVSLYSIGYTRDTKDKGINGFLYNLFVLSMFGVVLARNVLTFLVIWETMSLFSYFLVTHERDVQSSKAGLVYAVMSHFGTAFIIGLFLILYRFAGSMDFVQMKALMGNVSEGIKTIVFLFAIIGFGTKAGVVPLHIWLPEAHPQAPSNVSALMSGVMIKTGIYGILRVVFDLLGGGPEWWGIIILSLGAISSVLGVMYALMEHDIKRLLAFHSVENIGIILLGLGASIVFKSYGFPGLAAVALLAGLYHTMNHAIFKALLFLGAGSVVHTMHTKNMEEMGGLLKKMPYTGLFFLIGSLAICAFPPFNGFVSEWLTYQALLQGYTIPSILSKVVLPLGGVALALTGALASACFVKAFGISFLGMPRSQGASHAREVSWDMITGMAILALLCLLLGIFPFVIYEIGSPVVKGFADYSPDFTLKGLAIITSSGAGISGAGIIISLLIIFFATMVFIRIVSGRAKVTIGPSWDCGIYSLTSRMQYTATAFTKPLKMIFSRIYIPRKAIKVEYIIKPFFVKKILYHGDITNLFDVYIYRPFINGLHKLAHALRLIQSGSLHLYLAYILITMVLLLIFYR